MIEKFTKEEIEIIREELKHLPKNHMKRTLCDKSIKRMFRLFKTQKEYGGIQHYEMVDAILLLADHTLCNYELKPQIKKKETLYPYKRATLVHHAIANEYEDFFIDIVNVIEEHFKTKIVEEESASDSNE